MTMFDAIDPGHLVALHVLLEEGHVTRAARRLGITQSSMSHRLGLLRRALGDPLFVRAGARLVPTPRALTMARPLAEALRALDACLTPEAPFEPSRSVGSLEIAMPDLLAPLAPRLVGGLVERAPALRVRLVNVVPELTALLARDTPTLALVPTRFVDDDMKTRALGDLRFGVVGRSGHPSLRRGPDVKQWLRYGHVVVRLGNERSNVIEDALARRGLTRRVALEVPSFLSGLLVVARTDLLMNAPTPLVDEPAEALGLVLREAPIPIPRVRFALAWHARFQNDSAHRWAREQVYEAVRPAFARGRT